MISTSDNYSYNKNLKSFAQANRNNSTKAEACLWKYVLRGGNIEGFTFNRQRPILNYIVDFMCKKLKLIVEVDGSSHDHGSAVRSDIERQKTLENHGYKVIRFENQEVLQHLESVEYVIRHEVEEIMRMKNILKPVRNHRRKR